MNLYAYVANDPVNMLDPSGKCGTDAEGRQVGLCSGSAGDAVAELIDRQAANSDSNVGSTDAALQAQGILVVVNGNPTASVNDSYVTLGVDPSLEGTDRNGSISLGLIPDSIGGVNSQTGESFMVPTTPETTLGHRLINFIQIRADASLMRAR